MTEPTVEQIVARIVTGGTIVCQLCNASDVTDDDHRESCPVWELRAALSALQERVEAAERERDEARRALRIVLARIGHHEWCVCDICAPIRAALSEWGTG